MGSNGITHRLTDILRFTLGMEVRIGQTYEHVKTARLYRVVAVAKHHETLEEYVVYEALYGNPVSNHWIRPVSEFVGEAVSPDGSFHPRFRIVKN